MHRYFKYGLILLVGLFIGYLGFHWYQSESATSRIQSSGIVEQVKEVLQLVTVEGHFAELYNYKDHYYYDWPMLSKKAIIKAKAKVLMGYDFTEVEIEVLPDDRLILLSHMPELETMSMDIEKEYYDLQEGTFNSFSMQDYNKMDKDIRAIMLARVDESELARNAEKQFQKIYTGLEDLLEMNGWRIDIADSSVSGQWKN